MPFISIITPAYNVEHYIGDTISSIKEQDFVDFESFIINDGSTDRTDEVISSAITHDPRFKLINTKNHGVSQARNLGKSYAKGNYIYFMDGDDLLVSGALRVIANSFHNSNADAILFNSTSFINETFAKTHTEIRSYTRKLQSNKIYNGTDILNTYFSTRPIVQPCMYVARRDLCVQTKFLSRTIHEDNAYFAEIFFEHVNSALFIELPLFLRRVRPDSITTTATSIRNIDGYLAGATHLCSRLPTYTRGEPVEIMREFIRNMLWDAIFLLHRLKIGTDTALVKRRILGTCGLLYSLNGMTLRQLFSFTRATIMARAGA